MVRSTFPAADLAAVVANSVQNDDPLPDCNRKPSGNSILATVASTSLPDRYSTNQSVLVKLPDHAKRNFLRCVVTGLFEL
jgi:hypothetical protein